MRIRDLPATIVDTIRSGTVIPAMPLALDSSRHFDPRRQRALVRYYIDAGAGGVAAGVHSTQFEIRDPRHGLFEPVLETVAGAIDEWSAKRGRQIAKIGGIVGRTDQAVREAEFLASRGYHAGLLSMAALKDASVDELVAHARDVAQIIPVIGFYLQPDVGGRILPYEFWRRFAELENVLAIKMAPFSRYRTHDVVRAVCDAGRAGEIALYTGNDDSIVVDLLTEYRIVTAGTPSETRVRIAGGLLGQWCVWVKRAVEMHAELRALSLSGEPIPQRWLTLGQELTDANAVIFDAAHRFAGCIPGIHEVLRRQGLLEGTWCLNPDECMSPGQAEELDRIQRSYPHLTDDDFVREHLTTWLE